jgi:hypothetical protein
LAILLFFIVLGSSPVPSQTSSLVINEFLPNPVGDDDALKPDGEWVELYNPTDVAVDVAGWVLKDDYDTHLLLIETGNTAPSGSVVASKDYLVVYRDGDSDFSLNQSEDRVRLFDDGDILIDSVSYSGSIEEGESWSLGDSGWVSGTVATPGEENIFPSEEGEEEPPPPAVTFSSPKKIAVGTAFAVSVSLKNFPAGGHRVKVLIGKGGQFYEGRTKSEGGEWLAWNASWSDFPRISVGVGGGGSGKVWAKTNADTLAGGYLIKVRLHSQSGNFDSATSALQVAGSPKSPAPLEESGERTEQAAGSLEEAPFVGEGEGAILGKEEVLKEEGALNFYLILGGIGILVGSGGLLLSFSQWGRSSTSSPRREARARQKRDIQK